MDSLHFTNLSRPVKKKSANIVSERPTLLHVYTVYSASLFVETRYGASTNTIDVKRRGWAESFVFESHSAVLSCVVATRYR